MGESVSINIVILAAGQGTRMRSRLPKVLQPLAGRPLLEHVIGTAESLKPQKICVVYGHGGEQVLEHFDGRAVDWALQEPQLGTGHAVLQVLPFINRENVVLVLYGDVPLTLQSSLAGLAEAYGVRLVFATQPTLWREDLSAEERATLWFGGTGDFLREPGHAYYSVGALAEGMARYNQTLLDVCATRGVECVDLAAEIPRDPSLFYDDCHFTEAGARAVADALAGHFATGPTIARVQ